MMIRWRQEPKSEWFDEEMRSLFQPIMSEVPDPREHPNSGKLLPYTKRPQYLYVNGVGRTVLRIDRGLLTQQVLGTTGEDGPYYKIGEIVLVLTWAYEQDFKVKFKYADEEPKGLVVPVWMFELLRALDFPRCLGSRFEHTQPMLYGKHLVPGADEDIYLTTI